MTQPSTGQRTPTLHTLSGQIKSSQQKLLDRARLWGDEIIGGGGGRVLEVSKPVHEGAEEIPFEVSQPSLRE